MQAAMSGHTKELRGASIRHYTDKGEPVLPRRQITQCGHRAKVQRDGNKGYLGRARFLLAAVHAKSPKKKWKEPGAQQALDKEWTKLEQAPWPNEKGKGAWGLLKS